LEVLRGLGFDVSEAAGNYSSGDIYVRRKKKEENIILSLGFLDRIVFRGFWEFRGKPLVTMDLRKTSSEERRWWRHITITEFLRESGYHEAFKLSASRLRLLRCNGFRVTSTVVRIFKVDTTFGRLSNFETPGRRIFKGERWAEAYCIPQGSSDV
jgi:hypothetical protein